MARIPRSDPNVRLAMADQPTMSPDALTGPGRALQGLGRAISGLQGAFEASAEPTDNEKFDAQLKQLQFHNESLDELQRRQAEFTPDNNPSTFTPEYQDWYNTKSQEYRGSISQNPKIQQNWQLNDERLGGELHRRAYGFQTDETTKRTVDTVISTFTGTIAKAPSGDAQSMADLVDMIDGQIGRVQGASPAQVEGMRNSLRDAAIKQLLLSVDPVDQPKVLEDFVGATVRDKSAPQPSDGLAPLGDLPQQGLPGSQSGASAVRPQSLNDTQRKKLQGVDPGLIDKFAALQGETGQTFNVNSGFRDAEKNAAVGGAKGSQHIKGNAIDIDVSSLSKEDRVSIIEKASALGFTGIGVYNRSLHLDLGNRRAWGPSHGSDSVPKWAAGAIAQHLAGGSAKTVDQAASRSPETLAAVNGVAKEIGAHPDAIGAVFTVESGKDWNPKARTGSYVGVSQIGRDTLKEMGVSPAEYASMSQAEQAAFYGKWLGHYKFADKMKASGIDFAAQPPARQAAILQAFQFAPNGDWVSKLGKGDTQSPVTATKQAKALGSTSIADMERHFVSAGVANNVTPIANRGLTQYAGLKGGVQVADASGRIPGQAMAEQIKGRVEGGERAPNTIPGAQQTADSRPQWVRPSIRTGMTEQLIKMRGAVQEQQRRALDALIDRAEKSAADGYMLPDEERALINQKMGQYGTVEMQARLKNAEDAANVTAQLKKLTPTQIAGQEAQLRAAMSQAGATPDVIAKAKAVEGLHTRMVKELNENPVGWAAEAGLIPPQQPITPETFTTEALQLRKQVVDGISGHYGPEFRKYFTKDERENLTAIFEKGGEPMVVMMGRMYDAFGDDMPRAVTEIAPKAPEAALAGYLLANGGDPQAVKDIAATINRRADPNYKGNVKMDEAPSTVAEELFGDAFKRYPQQAKDAVVRAAEAIYIARVKDPAVYEGEAFRTALKAATGQRTNAAGKEFGGILKDTSGGDSYFARTVDPIVIPSNARRDTFFGMLSTITQDDLQQAGIPLPVTGTGKPLSLSAVIGSKATLVNADSKPGKYAVSFKDDNGGDHFVHAVPADVGVGNADPKAPLKPVLVPFILDLEKLTPILRKRMPEFFWSE